MKKKTSFKLITDAGTCYRIKFDDKKDFDDLRNKLKQRKNDGPN